MRPTVMIGDARAGLRTLNARSASCAVTSPPYWGLRAYTTDRREHGVGSLDAWVADVAGTFDELRRVLADTGTLWVVVGDTKVGSGGAGGDYGLFRDGVQHTAQGSRKDRPRYRQGDAGGRLARSSAGAPFLLEQEMMARGWVLRSRIVWVKTTTTGKAEYRREDLAHVKRPKMQHEYVQMWTGPGVYVHNVGVYAERFPDHQGDVWHGPSAATPPRGTWRAKAPFPEWLVERCLRLSAPEKRRPVVVDPYCGSCTTLAVAGRLGWGSVGIDLDPDTITAARARLTEVNTITL